MNRAFWIAGICAVAPLAAGLFALVAWLLTKSDRFAIAGVYVLAIGPIIVAVGVLALLTGVVQAWRRKELSPVRLFLTSIACLILLASNFPIAYACVMIAATTMLR